MKICSKCQVDLPLNQFYSTGKGYVGGICKKCKIEAGKARRAITNCATDKEWYDKNKDVLNQKRRERRKIDVEYRQQDIDRSKKFRKANPLYSNEYLKEWSKKNKIQTNLRRRFKRAFGSSSPHIINLVGCDIGTFKNWLSNQFCTDMNWNNYGSVWSIDHIIPLSFAQTEEDMIQLFHFMNCRPLYVAQNSAKNNRIDRMAIETIMLFESIPSKLISLAQKALD